MSFLAFLPALLCAARLGLAVGEEEAVDDAVGDADGGHHDGVGVDRRGHGEEDLGGGDYDVGGSLTV